MEAAEQLVGAPARVGLGRPDPPRAEQQLLTDRGGKELVLGILEDGPDPASELRAGQRANRSWPRPAASASPEITEPARGRRRPARSMPSVDLPLPFGPMMASASADRTATSTLVIASTVEPGYRKATCSPMTSVSLGGRGRRGGAAGG